MQTTEQLRAAIDALIREATDLIVHLGNVQEASESEHEAWEDECNELEDGADAPIEPDMVDHSDDITKLEECIDYLANAARELDQ